MELKTEYRVSIGGMPAEIFEAGRASGLSVSTAEQSTFNRQLLNFSATIAAPHLARIEVLSSSVRASIAEIDRLRIEVSELRQVRASFAPPPCPPGHIEYEYGAGVSTGAKHATKLICHLEHSKALPATETDAAESASVTLIAAYHHGVNVLDTLISWDTAMCIEAGALAEVMS